MRLNVAAFEYPAGFDPFRHDIAGGLGGMPVKGGLIDVPDRPGPGVRLIRRNVW
jgi:L-alanine-DL-glutamate epimerase-like enolase superfamily enzyme